MKNIIFIISLFFCFAAYAAQPSSADDQRFPVYIVDYLSHLGVELKSHPKNETMDTAIEKALESKGFEAVKESAQKAKNPVGNGSYFEVDATDGETKELTIRKIYPLIDDYRSVVVMFYYDKSTKSYRAKFAMTYIHSDISGRDKEN